MALTKHLLSAPALANSLTIGIPSIDREHSELISVLDALITDSGTAPESESFSLALTRLGYLLSAHFTHEEEILGTLGMPTDSVCRHKQAHDSILDQYAKLNLDLMQSKELNRYDVHMMIKAWIVGHFIQYDQQMKAYFPP